MMRIRLVSQNVTDNVPNSDAPLRQRERSRARTEISPGIYQYDLRTIVDWFNIAWRTINRDIPRPEQTSRPPNDSSTR